jgi:uncharacterized protein (TIGR03067 family)
MELAMLYTTLICWAAAIPGAADSATNPASKAELDKLQGTWEVVRVEAAGKLLPGETTKGWTLVIDGAKYTLHEGDRTVEGVLKLDLLTSPRAIDAVRTSGADKGKTRWGIYSLEGDQLKICFVEPDAHQRPKQFTTSGADGGQSLYVLKRAPKR